MSGLVDQMVLWDQARPEELPVRDTSVEAARLQQDIQEQLGGVGRLRLAAAMSDAALALALAGLRARHPTWTMAQLCRELHRTSLAS